MLRVRCNYGRHVLRKRPTGAGGGGRPALLDGAVCDFLMPPQVRPLLYGHHTNGHAMGQLVVESLCNSGDNGYRALCMCWAWRAPATV